MRSAPTRARSSPVRYLDWDLADPAGKALDEVRSIRDDMDRRVRALLVELTASSSA